MLTDVSPSRAGRVLAVVITLLVALSVGGQVWQKVLGHDSHRRAVRLVSLDEERNLPTAYQGLALGAASLLLASTALAGFRTGSRRRWHWAFLALIFAYMAADEVLRIHEQLKLAWAVSLSRQIRDVSPLFAHRWIVYAIPAVAVVGLAYLPFVIGLPPGVRGRVVAAGVMFVGGALGMEMAASVWTKSHGLDNMTYAMLATAEETLEMAGVAVFIHAVLLFRAAGDDGRPAVARSRPVERRGVAGAATGRALMWSFRIPDRRVDPAGPVDHDEFEPAVHH